MSDPQTTPQWKTDWCNGFVVRKGDFIRADTFARYQSECIDIFCGEDRKKWADNRKIGWVCVRAHVELGWNS